MKQSFLNNDRIYLRAVEPEDLDVMYEMENDPSMWDISNFTVPYSRYVLRQYIEGSQCDVFADKQLRLMIISRSESEETLIESRHSWKAGPGFILAAQFFQGFFPHILGVTVHQVVLIFFRDEPCVLFELVIQLFAFPAAVSQEEADVLIYFIALQDVFLYLIKVSVQIQTFADGYCAGDICQGMKVEQGICGNGATFV